MIDDLRLAFVSLKLRFALFIIGFAFFTTSLVFALLAFAAHALIISTDIISTGWLESIAGVGSALLVLVIGWFLFPAISTALSGLFLEQLADRIEAQQYEGLPAPRQIGWGEQISSARRALTRAIGLNAIALPFYFIPGLNLMAYFVVNAQLLAREYFFTIALRHIPLPQAQALLEENRWKLWRRGALIAGLFIIPGVNLLAPILATALMTHTMWQPGTGLLRQKLALPGSNVLPTPP